MDAEIFMGITHYQRLKHMVCEKEHSRATGPIVNLNRQPSEGRTRDGGFRFGEMEGWCLVSTSPIQLYTGRAIEFGELYKNNIKLLSYNEELGGITPENQLNFKENGIKRCVKLTLEDGRTLTLTPQHKLLTLDNGYIEVQNLKKNIDRIKCGVNYPKLNIDAEMDECNNWSMTFGDIILKTNSEYEFMKTLAFMRIIGFLITDGHIHKTYNIVKMFMGHEIDLNQLIYDLELFKHIDNIDINNYCIKEKYSYTVKLPPKFAQSIIQIKGLIRGSKIDSEITGIPDFILDENCPKPIIREFLGGMFGGDGHSPYIYIKNDRTIFTKEKRELKLLIEEYTKINNKINHVKKTIIKWDIHYIKNDKERKLKEQKTGIKHTERKREYLSRITISNTRINTIKEYIQKQNILKEKIRVQEKIIENTEPVANSCGSIAFSITKYKNQKHILPIFFNSLTILLSKFNIKSDTNNIKETYMSVYNKTKNKIKRYEQKLIISPENLITFSEEIGFRYCCHKNQRLEAVVSYYRLRENVLRQRNIVLKYAINNSNYIEEKRNKNTKIESKSFADYAINKIIPATEPIIHKYVAEERYRVDDHINIKTGKITEYIYIDTTTYFPIIGEYLISIDAYKWFKNNNEDIKIIEKNENEDNAENENYNINEIEQIAKTYNLNDTNEITEIIQKHKKYNKIYSVHADSKCLPTMNLKVIDIRDAGEHDVYDIEVENNHSYLANGIVSHNCMISHGTSNMFKERMLDVSDHFKTYTCNNCGNFANVNTKENIYECVYCNNKLDFSEIHMPYPCKLFFQELQSMAITPRIFTK